MTRYPVFPQVEHEWVFLPRSIPTCPGPIDEGLPKRMQWAPSSSLGSSGS
jgi:hypothetical protein